MSRRRGILIVLGGVIIAVFAGGLLLMRQPGEPSETIAVPSGQVVQFQEVVWGQRGVGGLTVRFRFLAPEIAREGGRINFEEAEDDMQYLCDNYALSRISDLGPRPAQVIISLANRAVEFGTADPSVTQFFEAYRIEGDACIWEGL